MEWISCANNRRWHLWFLGSACLEHYRVSQVFKDMSKDPIQWTMYAIILIGVLCVGGVTLFDYSYQTGIFGKTTPATQSKK